MTIYNGVNYDKYMAGQVLDQGLWGGKVQVSYDKFTGNVASADVIKLCKLPKNARVLPISIVKLNASKAIQIGIEGAANKFYSGSPNLTATFSSADGTQIGAETPLWVTMGANATGLTVEVWVFYVQAG